MSSVWRIVAVVAVFSVFQGTEAKSPSRVVGGHDGEIGEFPYMASLRRKNKHVCGATIIGKRHLLTAAHCVRQSSKHPSTEIAIVTGVTTMLLGTGTTRAIKKIVVHPEFSDNREDYWKNDIAVLALKKDIVFDAFTKPAFLPIKDTRENRKGVASGWGRTSYPNGTRPIRIRKLSMVTVSNEKCNKYFKRNISDTHLCAYGGAKTGLCKGDSGGPLVQGRTIVGITSFVKLCAKGAPDVFTRVFAYLDFIKSAVSST